MILSSEDESAPAFVGNLMCCSRGDCWDVPIVLVLLVVEGPSSNFLCSSLTALSVQEPASVSVACYCK